MVAVNIYRFTLPCNYSEKDRHENCDNLMNILNQNYLGYLYSKKGETRNAVSGEENKDNEEQNKSHSGCSDTSGSNIPENLEKLEKYCLNDKKYFYVEDFESAKILSGQYIHRAPFWINLAHEDIFKESRVSPFCIIFIEQKIVKENQKIIWAISYGCGYLLLDTSKATRDFGRGIALSEVDYKHITKLSTVSPSRKGKMTNTAISSGATPEEYSIDEIVDIPTRISGNTLKNNKTETTIHGGINLCITKGLNFKKDEGKIKNLNELKKLCEEYEEKYQNYMQEISSGGGNINLKKLGYYESLTLKEEKELKIALFKDILKNGLKGENFDLYISYMPDFNSEDLNIESTVIQFPGIKAKDRKNKAPKDINVNFFPILSSENITEITKFLEDNRDTLQGIPDNKLYDSFIKNIKVSFKGNDHPAKNIFDYLSGFYYNKDKDIYYYMACGRFYKTSETFQNKVNNFIENIFKNQDINYNHENDTKKIKDLLDSAVGNCPRHTVKNKEYTVIHEADFNLQLADLIRDDNTSLPKKWSHNSLLLDLGGNKDYNGVKPFEETNDENGDSSSIKLKNNYPIELCDLYVHKGIYIHVKNNSTDAEGFSHLLNQSYTSTKWVLDSPDKSYPKIKDLIENLPERIYNKIKRIQKSDKNNTDKEIDIKTQEKVKKIVEKFPEIVTHKSLKPQEIVLVLLYRGNEGNIPLSTLSQIALYHHIHNLEKLGVKVTVYFQRTDENP